MYCNSCGRANPEDAVYCSGCGTKLAAVQGTAPETGKGYFGIGGVAAAQSPATAPDTAGATAPDTAAATVPEAPQGPAPSKEGYTVMEYEPLKKKLPVSVLLGGAIGLVAVAAAVIFVLTSPFMMKSLNPNKYVASCISRTVDLLEKQDGAFSALSGADKKDPMLCEIALKDLRVEQKYSWNDVYVTDLSAMKLKLAIAAFSELEQLYVGLDAGYGAADTELSALLTRETLAVKVPPSATAWSVRNEHFGEDINGSIFGEIMDPDFKLDVSQIFNAADSDEEEQDEFSAAIKAAYEDMTKDLEFKDAPDAVLPKRLAGEYDAMSVDIPDSAVKDFLRVCVDVFAKQETYSEFWTSYGMSSDYMVETMSAYIDMIAIDRLTVTVYIKDNQAHAVSFDITVGGETGRLSAGFSGDINNFFVNAEQGTTEVFALVTATEGNTTTVELYNEGKKLFRSYIERENGNYVCTVTMFDAYDNSERGTVRFEGEISDSRFTLTTIEVKSSQYDESLKLTGELSVMLSEADPSLTDAFAAARPFSEFDEAALSEILIDIQESIQKDPSLSELLEPYLYYLFAGF